MNQFMKILPPYTLGQSIYFDASMKDLAEFRAKTLGEGEDLNPEWWRLENVAGDLWSLGLHFFFWTFVLILIEMGLSKQIKDIYVGFMKSSFPKYQTFNVDPDVEEEARRVNDPTHPDFQPDHEMQIKVKNLRKVYLRDGLCSSGAPLCAVE